MVESYVSVGARDEALVERQDRQTYMPPNIGHNFNKGESTAG